MLFVGSKRLIKMIKKVPFNKDSVESKGEFIEAERLAIKIMQKESFPNEIKILKEGKPIKN